MQLINVGAQHAEPLQVYQINIVFLVDRYLSKENFFLSPLTDKKVSL